MCLSLKYKLCTDSTKNCTNKNMSTYSANDYENLRFKFPGAENIQQNFSQAYQDLFVLSMLKGLRNGTYLEIGSNEPFNLSNTALLETEFNWSGVSIDIMQHLVDFFNSQRKNKAICTDALDLDYNTIFNINEENVKLVKVNENVTKIIDYLQVDCEPPQVTFEILKKILDSNLVFKVITFEHECYYAGDEIKLESRKLLASHGYTLVVSDICNDFPDTAYEDWYVHPEYVDKEIIDLMSPEHFEDKIAREYILNSQNVWRNK